MEECRAERGESWGEAQGVEVGQWGGRVLDPSYHRPESHSARWDAIKILNKTAELSNIDFGFSGAAFPSPATELTLSRYPRGFGAAAARRGRMLSPPRPTDSPADRERREQRGPK